MNIFTYSEARQKLSMLMNIAKKEGKVIITRKDGSKFELRAINDNKSPLDVKGVDLNINLDEILNSIDESRNYKK